MNLRRETSADFGAIHNVTVEAFSQSSYGHNGEAQLIESLRNNCEIISLVAELNGEVVAHALFSPARIQTSGDEVRGMALAPVSVRPCHQNNGIGGKLIREGLLQCRQNEAKFTIVVGSPAYYARFGFRTATEFGVIHGFAGIPQEVLQIAADDFQPLVEAGGGKVYYHREFEPQFEN